MGSAAWLADDRLALLTYASAHDNLKGAITTEYHPALVALGEPQQTLDVIRPP